MRFSPSARACRLTFPPMLRIMKAPKGVFFMRHAWLIIAHGNFEILEKQLRFLDSENADFFIHVDARVKDFDFAHVRSIPRKSRVTFLDRKPISWGAFFSGRLRAASAVRRRSGRVRLLPSSLRRGCAGQNTAIHRKLLFPPCNPEQTLFISSTKRSSAITVTA